MIEQSTYCSLATSGWDDRSKKMCCLVDLPKYKNFTEMHKDKKVSNLLTDLESGKKNNACKECWNLESNGIVSMRQQSLKNEGGSKSLEMLEQEALHKKLKYLVLDSGLQCNFACRTCGPHSSTGHTKEWIAKTGKEWQQRPISFDAIVSEDLSSLTNIEVLGGEPFVNLNHLQIVDKVKDNKLYWLTYTTNGSVKLNKEIYDRFKNFKAVHICLSIDAIGKQFEYIRTLGKWNKVKENIGNLLSLKKQIKHLSVANHITVSALNLFYLDPLLEYLNSIGITSDFTFCEGPDEYSLKIFTEKELDHIKIMLAKSIHLKPVYDYVQSVKHDPMARKYFHDAVDFTKSYRQLDYKDYLPKLFDVIV